MLRPPVDQHRPEARLEGSGFQIMIDYNYPVFDMTAEERGFLDFRDHLHVGERAPDFPLEDLESGATVRLKDLWAKGPVVIEFGSFT